MFVLLLLFQLSACDRLPTSVVPIQYNISIATYLHNFSFQGDVSIKVECRETTNNITLHAVDLVISQEEVTVITEEGQKILVLSVTQQTRDGFLVLKLAESLQEGHHYTLFIPFRSALKFQWTGYYSSFYYEQITNNKIWYAITQFEAGHARKAFPCFDEPRFKARFKLRLGHEKNYSSVSNMPLEKIECLEDLQWDYYKVTPMLPTYIIAFMVSDFDYRIYKSDNKDFRIWTRPGKQNLTEFAGDWAPRLLAYYEKYFGTKGLLEKMDIVAAPYFHRHAMENWGLVVFREQHVLHPTMPNALVIAHELAHQWIGNLVTIKWWDDMWLKESLAMLFQVLGVHAVKPEWNVPVVYILESGFEAMRFDSLASAAPLFVPDANPDSITSFAYKKGLLILRMVYLLLGEENFQKGMVDFLRTFQYGNADRNDFWRSLDKYQNVSHLKEMMNTWITQPGFPVITVIRDYDKNSINITQARYVTSKEMKTDGTCWIVPLTYTTQEEANFKNTDPKMWLNCSGAETVYSRLPSRDNWIIFNIMFSGFYRVHYDERNWDMIIATLKSRNYDMIDILNRAQLVSDACALADIGRMHYNKTLRLIDYLEWETSALIFHHITEWMETMNKRLLRTPHHSAFDRYASKIKSLKGLNRRRMLDQETECAYESEDCLQLFQIWMSSSKPDLQNPIPKHLRSFVYCKIIRHGTKQEKLFLQERYDNDIDLLEIKIALACTRNEAFLLEYLKLVLSFFRDSDSKNLREILLNIARNDRGFRIARYWLFKNTRKLLQVFRNRLDQLKIFVQEVTKSMHTNEELRLIEKFVAENDFLSDGEKAVDMVRHNNVWHKKRYEEFVTVLRDRQL